MDPDMIAPLRKPTSGSTEFGLLLFALMLALALFALWVAIT